MTRIVLSPKAQADIDDIFDYTEAQWGFEQAATYTAVIRNACQDLAIGRRLSRSADHLRPGYRTAKVRSHVLYYRVRADGSLYVIRILHERMDSAHHL